MLLLKKTARHCPRRASAPKTQHPSPAPQHHSARHRRPCLSGTRAEFPQPYTHTSNSVSSLFYLYALMLASFPPSSLLTVPTGELLWRTHARPARPCFRTLLPPSCKRPCVCRTPGDANPAPRQFASTLPKAPSAHWPQVCGHPHVSSSPPSPAPIPRCFRNADLSCRRPAAARSCGAQIGAPRRLRCPGNPLTLPPTCLSPCPPPELGVCALCPHHTRSHAPRSPPPPALPHSD